MSIFDTPIERRDSDSIKWGKYAGRDVLPLWVADMDFAAPSLMLQGEWTTFTVVIAVAKAVLAVMLWASAVTGFWKIAMTWPERITAIVAACLLVAYFPWSDEIGIALAVALAARHWARARRKTQQ